MNQPGVQEDHQEPCEDCAQELDEPAEEARRIAEEGRKIVIEKQIWRVREEEDRKNEHARK